MVDNHDVVNDDDVVDDDMAVRVERHTDLWT